jgi:hypothetical protein
MALDRKQETPNTAFRLIPYWTLDHILPVISAFDPTAQALQQQYFTVISSNKAREKA